MKSTHTRVKLEFLVPHEKFEAFAGHLKKIKDLISKKADKPSKRKR